MELDPVFVARLQFAFTIIFHIIFPTFTIGLSAYIATLCVMWMRTGRERYRLLAQFWTKIFAVSFALGVVSGVVLSYQFGTNWSRFSVVVGNVIGPMIGYEVLVAFFLEATFLGVMLFGWNRVPPWLHTLSAIAVAIGTALSAFWILSANSWMQTPAGYEMRDGIAYPVDWLAVVFNPSFPYRLAHMVTAAYLTVSFVVLAVGARYVLAGRHLEHGRTMVRMAVGFAAIVAPLQLFIGDQHGLNTLAHQPLKIAAIEAHWDGDAPGELVLFAWPDEATEFEPFCSDDPAWRFASPHSQLGWTVSRSEERAAARPPAGRAAVLRIPRHGRHRHDHDPGRADRRIVVVAQPFVRGALVSLAGAACLVDGLCRGDLRLDRHRNRTAALGGLRSAENRRSGLAARGQYRGHDSRIVRAGLRRGVRNRSLLHQPIDRARTTRPHA